MKKEPIYYSVHVSTYNVLDSEKKKDNVAHFTEHKLPKNPHQKSHRPKSQFYIFETNMRELQSEFFKTTRQERPVIKFAE